MGATVVYSMQTFPILFKMFLMNRVLCELVDLRWPRGSRRESTPARVLGFSASNHARGHGFLSVVSVACCQVCVGIITHPEESYRM
jgi:hypothetical protein